VGTGVNRIPPNNLLLKSEELLNVALPLIPSPLRERVRVRVKKLICFTLPVISPPFLKGDLGGFSLLL
jgi:hypothetical protein